MTDAIAPAASDRRRSRRMLAAIALVVAAPVIVSYALYYFGPPRPGANYGDLLSTAPVAAVAGTRTDGGSFDLATERGRWTVVFGAPAACDAPCASTLYATRQARTMQGRERERVHRVWLVIDGAMPEASVLAEHPDVTVVRSTPAEVRKLPRGGSAIYLVDPVGHQVLAWPADPDIRAVARDLSRVLKASRIG